VPKKTKSTEEHLRTIELMLAGILLSQDSKPEVKKLAKLIRVSDKALSELFPQTRREGQGREARTKTTNE